MKAAAELGYPVVLKADGDIEHKTEAGAVKLDLRDAAAVRAACAAMTAAKNGFLVQSMVTGGVELVVGVKRDPQCGPVLLVGLGGVLVEVLRDTALALAPVGRTEARRMLERLKGFKLLQGYRGAPAADLDAVCDAIARISEFAADHADAVEEIDVNPLLARPDGALALDALIVLRAQNSAMLISEKYREQQRELHERARTTVSPRCATRRSWRRRWSARAWTSCSTTAPARGASRLRCEAILKRPSRCINTILRLPELSAAPQPCAFVVCIDVLEHIEPELLGNVLDDLQRVTAGLGVFTVHTGPP